METMINYVQVKKNKALEHHLETHLERLKPRLSQKAEVRIWLKNASSLLSRGLPQFQTKISVVAPKKKTVFVEAASNNLVNSINQAFKKALNQ